jgi:hypothetical protein
MKYKRTRNGWGNTLAAGALALAAHANAQDGQAAPEKKIDASLEHFTFGTRFYGEKADDSSLFTQTVFGYKNEHSDARGILATQPNQTDYGLNTRLGNYEFNLGLKDAYQGSDTERFSLAALGDNDSFIEGTFNMLPGEERFILAAGTDLEGMLRDFRVEATIDNERNVRGALMYKIKDGTIALGAGTNRWGQADFNFYHSGENTFGKGVGDMFAVKFGERPIDARLIIGKVAPEFAKYFATVRNLGDNELDVYGDQTLQFNSGGDRDVRVDYFGAGTEFLKREAGSWAIDARFQEDDRAYVDFGYSFGKVGVFDNLRTVTGAYHDFNTDTTGARAQLLGNIGNFEVGLSGAIGNKGEPKIGLFVGFSKEF